MALLPTIQIIKSVLPLLDAALETFKSFQGDDPKSDTTLQNAADILREGFPLLETFAKGNEVTQEDAEAAFAGYDQAMEDLNAEIAKQEAGG